MHPQINPASISPVSLFFLIMNRYLYIVKDSVTTDPDIMLREIENYKLQIPPYIQVRNIVYFIPFFKLKN